ncbi:MULTISPECIES: hypothetical protein [Caballeronia]|uniref:hypothetical protein n=1 Tax=Caballeronia TaxID=1827195 RepID=UPI001EF55CB9|nr:MULTISPECIES: hypothetical protein [Caballeronia]MCG7402266.1 hypothetical protein [Caballeronia zhejiangensis]MCI1047140.1 hypothetical protein [Caballeronia zhejiangensis]
MKFLQGSRPSLVVLIYTGIAFFLLVFNPQALYYGPGSVNGVYIDRVDSFSEYIVRNTVKDRVLNPDNHSVFPLFTKGFPDDLGYYPQGSHHYYSNLTLQTLPAVLVAKALHLNTEAKVDGMLAFLRYANAFLLTLFSCTFLMGFARRHGIRHHFATPFLVGGSAGFVFYSGNLYFFSALMLMPAAFIAWRAGQRARFPMLAIALVALPYFLRGYEFSTIIALLTALSACLFADGDGRARMRSGIRAFVAVVLAFVVAVIVQILLIRISVEGVTSLSSALKTAFATLGHRTMSTSGVPKPFGTDFLLAMRDRWNAVAFSLTPDGIRITELQVILLVMLAAAVRVRHALLSERAIFAYAFVSYASWYIFAYQHIMWHGMYEWYVFALTVSLSFSLLALVYIDRLVAACVTRFSGPAQ